MNHDKIHWLLLEDEHYTASELARLVGCAGPHYHNIGIIETCRGFREFWSASPAADLIIADESLADGPVVGVFHDMDVSVPVIMVTSNEGCRRGDFRARVVSILLHPVGISEMHTALRAYETMAYPSTTTSTLNQLN